MAFLSLLPPPPAAAVRSFVRSPSVVLLLDPFFLLPPCFTPNCLPGCCFFDVVISSVLPPFSFRMTHFFFVRQCCTHTHTPKPTQMRKFFFSFFPSCPTFHKMADDHNNHNRERKKKNGLLLLPPANGQIVGRRRRNWLFFLLSEFPSFLLLYQRHANWAASVQRNPREGSEREREREKGKNELPTIWRLLGGGGTCVFLKKA